MNAKKLPDVGARLRTLRERRGLSLRALAEMCNVSPNTVSLIERGLSSPCVEYLAMPGDRLGGIHHGFLRDGGAARPACFDPAA